MERERERDSDELLRRGWRNPRFAFSLFLFSFFSLTQVLRGTLGDNDRARPQSGGCRRGIPAGVEVVEMRLRAELRPPGLSLPLSFSPLLCIKYYFAGAGHSSGRSFS